MTVVQVVGPPLSGATAVAAALRRELLGCHVTETATAAPDAVVFVLSAAAPMASCDAAFLDAAADGTDSVVAVVAKTDVHRTWPEVLESNRVALARHSPRYRATPWVGVAANPQVGPLVIDPLLNAVRAALADTTTAERNLRRAAKVRAEHAARRQAQADQRALWRSHVRHTRLELGAEARACAVTLRADLQRRAGNASRRELARFDEQVRSQVLRTADRFDVLVAGRLAQLCRTRGLPVPEAGSAPQVWEGLPPAQRPPSDSVTAVFAASFGLGVALTLARFLDELGGGRAWALAGCGAVGMALSWWVTRTRRLAAARLAADRWVAEVCAGLRNALEDRVLAAESSLLAAIAAEGRTPN